MEEELLEKKWYKKWWGILLIIVSTAFLVMTTITALYILDIVRSINSGISPGSNYTLYDRSLTDGNVNNYYLGSVNAKVTIVEFSDFGCPYCRNSQAVIRDVSIKYKDQIKYIYRDYPIVTKNSLNLAMAARCAGEQGLFWPMHDILFLNQGIVDNNEIINLATNVGVNKEEFVKCTNSNKYLANIQKDLNDGKKLKISGTPTWFINGYKIEGEIPISIFTQIINQMLLDN